MKKALSLILVLALVLISPSQGLARDVEIYLDGKKVETDVAPFVKNDRTLVPIRFISESLGYQVDWIQESQMVVITGDKTIKLVLNKPLMVVDGQEISLDVAPLAHKDRTMVPLRAISEAFGIAVGWNQEDYRVVLETRSLPHMTPEEKAYFLALKEGQKDFMTQFRKMQDTLSKDMGTLSRDQVLSQLTSVETTINRETNKVLGLTAPAKFVPVRDLYLKTLSQMPPMVEAYKKAYLENDQGAARDLVSKFFYLNLQASELQRAMEAIEKGQEYTISKDYQDFNTRVNQGNNIFSDNLIGNLLKQL